MTCGVVVVDIGCTKPPGVIGLLAERSCEDLHDEAFKHIAQLGL